MATSAWQIEGSVADARPVDLGRLRRRTRRDPRRGDRRAGVRPPAPHGRGPGPAVLAGRGRLPVLRELAAGAAGRRCGHGVGRGPGRVRPPRRRPARARHPPGRRRCTTGTCPASCRRRAAGPCGTRPSGSPTTPPPSSSGSATGSSAGRRSTSRGARRSSATQRGCTRRGCATTRRRCRRRTTSCSVTGSPSSGCARRARREVGIALNLIPVRPADEDSTELARVRRRAAEPALPRPAGRPRRARRRAGGHEGHLRLVVRPRRGRRPSSAPRWTGSGRTTTRSSGSGTPGRTPTRSGRTAPRSPARRRSRSGRARR